MGILEPLKRLTSFVSVDVEDDEPTGSTGRQADISARPG